MMSSSDIVIIVGSLTFMSLTSFIFLCKVSGRDPILFFNVDMEFTQHYVLKTLSFPHYAFLAFLLMVYIWIIIFHKSICLTLWQTHTVLVAVA